MGETVNFGAPEPEAVVADKSCFQPPAEPQLTYEECDTQSLLWPFYNDTEPKTLEDIGFELNITPSIMHLFPPSSLSSHSVHKVADNGMEPLPNHQLPPPSQVLQIDAANSEEISRMQEIIGDGSGVTSAAAEHSFDVNQFLEEPTWMEERMGDGSGVTSAAVEHSFDVNQFLEEPTWMEERMGDGSRVTSAAAEHSFDVNQFLEEPTWMEERMGDGSGVTCGVAEHFSDVNHSLEEPSRTEERMGNGSGETFSGPAKKPTKRRVSDDDSWMPEGWVKKVSQRPPKGKFPGYVDKKYYAPGVARAFRSKVEALRYIENLKNAAKSSNM